MKSILRFLCAILAIGFVACSEPDYGSIPDTTITSLGTPDSNNEIWFITTDGKPLLSLDKNAFDAKVVEIINSEYGVNRIVFDSAVKRIGANAFNSCHNIFNLSLLLVDNKTILDYKFEVGHDFEEDDTAHLTLHLEIDLGDPLPDVKPEGGEGGGFDASVSDWGEEIEHEVEL